MPKRVTKKIITTTENVKSPKRKSSPRKKIETQIVENLIELQKVHTDLAEKFDKLSSELSSLLSLFEMAARSFAKSTPIKQTERDQEFLEKINRLLDQNKTIAKGLAMMEEKVRERMYGPSQVQQPKAPQENEYQPSTGSRPLPKF